MCTGIVIVHDYVQTVSLFVPGLNVYSLKLVLIIIHSKIPIPSVTMPHCHYKVTGQWWCTVVN